MSSVMIGYNIWYENKTEDFTVHNNKNVMLDMNYERNKANNFKI